DFHVTGVQTCALPIFSDALSMTIANRVSILLLATFVVLALLTGMALPEIGMHLLAGVAVLAVTFVLFALGGMGGGDAKLIAATRSEERRVGKERRTTE